MTAALRLRQSDPGAVVTLGKHGEREMALHVYYGSEYLGHIATWSEITRKVLEATACGAEGVLFIRDDGSFGIEDADAVELVGVREHRARQLEGKGAPANDA